MSSRVTTRTAVTIAAATVVSGLIAYAVYFDYKRRSDPTFRKKLRKEKKRAERTKPSPVELPGSGRGIEEIKQALQTIRAEVLPTTVDEKEQYFMDNVQLGEQLSLQGPAYEVPAALAFYRALRVYPSPVELIMIYQKTMPEPVFKLVMQMTSLDVKQRAEGYYDVFPEKSYNVRVTLVDIEDPQIVAGTPLKKHVLVADKDFEPGDVIYKELPLIGALDVDLEGKGTHCSQCFRQIVESMVIKAEDDPLNAAYCSEECQLQAATQHHNLLFRTTPPIVLEASKDVPIDAEKVATRKAAQQKLFDNVKASGKSGLLLVSRFTARMVSDEMRKLTAAATTAKIPGDDYSLFDHMERLKYLEIDGAQGSSDNEALVKVLKLGAEGTEQFLNDGRYAMLLGKVAYNVVGVTFGEGRDDKPESTLRIEDRERTRTPSGTERQIGSGLYLVSSYLAHSCSPSVRPTFPSGTNELHLIANQKISKGDQLTMSYVDNKIAADANVVETRRARRMELARGWRFACACPRCKLEAPVAEGVSKEDVQVEGPGAQVEAVVSRFENGEAGPEHRSKADADDVE